MPQLTRAWLPRAALLARMLLALLLLWQAARWAFQPDALDQLRQADTLFAAGRFYEARGAYVAVIARAPDNTPALVRLGMVYVVRNEHALADQTLARAIGLGLGQRDLELARLYQGQLLAGSGQRDRAAQFWATIGAQSPVFAVGRVLAAENQLALADYAGTEATYRVAVLAGLPAEWRALVATRLALLRATSDPTAALAELDRQDGLRAPLGGIDFAAPLLPIAAPDARQLREVLQAPAEERTQLLGQLYLSVRLYALAEAQFAAVPAGNPNAVAAAAYAAYSRWSAGDHAEGLRRLQALVHAHPSEPRARGLLALAYLSNRDTRSAEQQLQAVRTLAPRAPDTHLAWGQWYAAQHEYEAAATAYRSAFDDALPDQRGTYALALARFHLDTSFRVCEIGRPAAQEAARLLADDPRAWLTLAAAQLRCNNPAAARAAAETATERAPGSAEAAYYLGSALLQLGERASARSALIGAADLAPASAWRARAEAQIASLGT